MNLPLSSNVLDFFNNLTQHEWGQQPLLLTSNNNQTLFSKQQVLEALQAFHRSLETNKIVHNDSSVNIYNRDNIVVSSKAHSSRSETALTQLLANDSVSSLDEYTNNLMCIENYDQFMIVLNNPHKHQSQIWQTIRQVIDLFSDIVEIPQDDIGADLFIGNYTSTTFGVHKDKLHNIMFMLDGEREMHFWQDNNLTDGYDPDTHQSFLMQAGDILYWSPQCWHIGENKGSVSTSLNINFWQNTPPWAKKAINRSINETVNALSEIMYPTFVRKNDGALDLPSSMELMHKVLAKIDVQLLNNNLQSQWLKRFSAGGLALPIPLDLTQSLDRQQAYQIDKCFPLSIIEQDKHILIGGHGHVWRKNKQQGWLELVNKINDPLPFTAKQLSAQADKIESNTLYSWLEELLQCRAIIACDL